MSSGVPRCLHLISRLQTNRFKRYISISKHFVTFDKLLTYLIIKETCVFGVINNISLFF